MNDQDSMVYGSRDGYQTDEITREIQVGGCWVPMVDYDYAPGTHELLCQLDEIDYEIGSIFDDFQKGFIKIDGKEMELYDELVEQRESIRQSLLKKGYDA